MEGEALIWFQDAENSGFFSDWEAFVKVVHERFGATSYDDPMESLTRLKQTSFVIAYKGQFEAISNRVRSLSELHKLSCFLSGLKDEVRLPVRMLGPKNLNKAFGLAKMQEEYLWSCRKSSKISHDGSRPSILGLPKPEHSIFTFESRTKVPLQGLTAAQMEEGRKKGLCYHCDEKWQSGHQCKGARIFLLEGVSFSQELPSSGPQLVELEANRFVVLPKGQELLQDTPEITLYALVGSPSPGTMRIEGKLQGHCLVILIDTGSTHNFLDAGLCSSLKLAIDPALAFDVKIAPLAYSEDTWCLSRFANANQFFKKPTRKGLLLQITTQLFIVEPTLPVPELESLLEEFATGFEVPQGLPPSRGHEQSIPLKEGTQAMCGRPYRYPYLLKTEIEKIVKELLEVGSIRPSQSPFSSPMLLVRKADDSWRMCIDYRALNQVTIKDKFPILVVDELLDELCGSMIFSKLDLRSGYYQIRMKAEDVPKTAFRTHEAAPLTNLLKKDGFNWIAEADSAFQHLKAAVMNPLVLALPDFSKPFIIECDASGVGIGVVLMQEQRPIAFHNKALKGRSVHISTYEKEFLALVTTVKRWRPYPLGKPFIIRTDH
ncbi:uncharacterized protein LOC142643233 [Castanea sativa]|uniref:uncharacterized protein LOC142643233 n=1 Tax=Castanea sativa TaxID=21020 RepID=UPI003F649564